MKKHLLILLLPLVLLSCKKDDPEQVFRLSKDFKAFCRFPVGSWWVYQDSSGVEDSLWVIKSTVTVKDGVQQIDLLNQYEQLSQHIQGNATTYYFNSDVMSSHIGDKGEEIGIYIYKEVFDTGNHNETADRFKWEPNNNYDVGTNVQHYHHYESFPVLDSIYGDVHVFGYPASTFGNTIHKEYFARGIGVVQREMFDGTVWKLNRYHIEK